MQTKINFSAFPISWNLIFGNLAKFTNLKIFFSFCSVYSIWSILSIFLLEKVCLVQVQQRIIFSVLPLFFLVCPVCSGINEFRLADVNVERLNKNQILKETFHSFASLPSMDFSFLNNSFWCTGNHVWGDGGGPTSNTFEQWKWQITTWLI